MAVRISGDGSISGLTDWEATSVTHPESADTNITLADDGSVAFDSIPADIQAAIDNIPQIDGIGSNVVQAVKTDKMTVTSTSFQNLLSLNFTPSSVDSKVLLHFGTTCRGTGGWSTLFELRRGNTSIGIGSDAAPGSVGHAQGTIPSVGQVDVAASSPNVVFLDSPGTTSAVTYSVRVRVLGGTTIVGDGRATSMITTLTAIEVAA